jgi:hypothetical protein
VRDPRPKRPVLLLVALGVVLGSGVAVVAPAPAQAASGFRLSAAVVSAVHGYSGEQLRNAAVIVAVAQRMGLGRHGAVLGVMTAMGESSLRNLDHGDGAINPDGTVADSVGLFQQQHWWGTLVERRTPAVAAARFFQRLRTVPHWRELSPTAAAHAVQGNADPHFYTRFLAAAEAVVAALLPAASAATLKASATTLQKAAHGTKKQAAEGAKAAESAKAASERVEALDLDLPDLAKLPSLPDLPDLPAMPDLPELGDVPDFSDLSTAGFGDAVLDELRQSGVALADQQEEPADAGQEQAGPASYQQQADPEQ